MRDQDLLKYGLTIECADAYELALTDKEAFINLRRKGFGASDSSIYTGVNLYTTVDDLVKVYNEYLKDALYTVCILKGENDDYHQ